MSEEKTISVTVETFAPRGHAFQLLPRSADDSRPCHEFTIACWPDVASKLGAHIHRRIKSVTVEFYDDEVSP